MPLIPNFIERQLIKKGIIPGLLMDVGLSMFGFAAVIAAAELQIFKILKDEKLDLESLANRAQCSVRGMEVLINTLTTLGYVTEKKGKYTLSRAARRSLPVELVKDMVPFFVKGQMLNYADAARGVREAPQGGIIGWDMVKSGDVGRSYQVTMRWLASGTLDEVVQKVKLPAGARRMLDVGGSHGLYTVAFCRKYPGLQGSVLDWRVGLENAEETLKAQPEMAERVDLIERDFEKEELPDGYDFAFLGNIIHGISPEGNRQLFAKLARATTDIGTIAIVDQFAGLRGSPFAKGVAALAGFNLFLFSGGRTYPFEDVKHWLNAVGFAHVTLKPLRKTPGFSLLVARKK